MGLEIERKFKVLPSWRPKDAGSTIAQGYITRDPKRTVRVRLLDARGFLTIKGETHGCTRAEYEYEIPAEDAHALLALSDRPPVEKTRYTEDIFAMRDCKKTAKKGLRSWQQEFIISYDPERKRKEKEKVPYGDALDMFRYILKYNRKDLLVELPDDLQRILHSFLQDHSRNLSIYTNKDILLEPISTNNTALRRAIDQLKKNAKQQNQTKGLLYPTIPNRVGQLSEKRVTEIFGLSAADIDRPTKTPAPQLTVEELREQKWAKREADYRRMLAGAKRIMRSDLPLDAALDYLRGYFDIREERNRSNHAVITAGQESSRLEQDIAAYIEKLRNHPSEPMP